MGQAKWMDKEALYVPQRGTIVCEHRVVKIAKSDGLPQSAYCKGCYGQRDLGLIAESRIREENGARRAATHQQPQIVCWVCCYGISPGFDTKEELAAWAMENL